MDQIKKLYDELVGYDPSLSQNKDAVLQLIQKMVDAKPTINVDTHRKESFGEKLQDHIARNQVYLSPASNRFSQWIAKWSLSLASLWVALLVVGAGYYWIQVGSQQRVAKKISSVDTQDRGFTSGEALSMISDDLGDDENKDVMNGKEESQKSLPPQQANVRALADVDGDTHANADIAFSDPTQLLRGNGGDISMSTEVDSSVVSMMKENPQYETTGGVGGGVGGGIDPQVMGSNDISTPTATSLVAPDMMQDATASTDLITKEIALVLTDTQGLLFDSAALEIISYYGIPITIIPYNAAQAEKLQKQGFPITDRLISSSQRGVIYIDVADINKNSDSLTKMIEKYQVEGYLFIEVSTTK